MSLSVRVAFPARVGSIGAALFERCARIVCEDEHVRDASISFVFLDDAGIHTINRQFLSHDYPTDVITFPLDEAAMEGEIYISVDTARANAAEYRVPFREELARLAVHGVLHLCGYDDGTEADRARMREQEDACLRRVLAEGRNGS